MNLTPMKCPYCGNIPIIEKRTSYKGFIFFMANCLCIHNIPPRGSEETAIYTWNQAMAKISPNGTSKKWELLSLSKPIDREAKMVSGFSNGHS
jgi:hypothetical protein